ncbi:MAG: hydantoin racemase [Thermoprotei archaeon]|nr:MAG: hydantoin racemase [Thermoprotei archaeon]
MAEYAILAPIVLFVLGAVISSVFKGKLGNYISSFFSLISSLIICYLSLSVLFYNKVLELQLRLIPEITKLPLPINLNVIYIKIDFLSAFFALILGVVGFASSIYGISYINRYLHKQHLGFYGLNYASFLCLMYLVFVIHDIFWFIVFWELMTVTSQFLVSYEKEKIVARKAAYKYFCMTKAGSEAIIVSALVVLIVLSGMNTSFDMIRQYTRDLLVGNPILANMLIALLFTGFSVKASLVPFHTWLPDAHPEAPSNVSALLSGVMIKTAVYMFFRIFYFFFEPTIYWGYIVATIGTITLFVGTMYAILQNDSKRLLAFSSIGQMGYIILALGASMVLYSINGKEYAILASAAFAASLYHVMNHAMFKSLLFLTAGSVIYRTGLRNLNVLGGLARFMPLTSISALIAALSVAGVPPFNGFVSKWLLYSSTIPSFTILTIYGVIALFISAVTAAYFIKYFTTLFAKPSSIKVKGLKDVPALMLFSQIFLALTCIVLGVYPIIPLTMISSISKTIFPLGDILSYIQVFPGIALLKVSFVSVNSPLIIAVALTLLSSITAAILPPRLGKFSVWSCGVSFRKYVMNMPAASYFKPFEESFSEIYSTGKFLHKVLVEDFIRNYLFSSRILAKITENFAVMLTLFILIIVLMLLMNLG